MRIDGIQLNEGSSISNLTIASGTAFPTNANEAELFFRTDTSLAVRGLYCYTGGNWDRIASADSLTVPTGAVLPTQQVEGDLFYRNTNDANEGLYVYDGSAWALVSAGGATFTITGDVTGTIDGGTDALTLASVIAPGTFGGSASSTTSVTVDAKGRVTAGSTTNIEISAAQVTTGTFSIGLIPAAVTRSAGTETISGSWTFSTDPVLNNATYLSGKNTSGTTTRMLGINGSNDIYLGSVDVAVGDWLFMNGTERMRLLASGGLSFGAGSGTTGQFLTSQGTSAPVWATFIPSSLANSTILGTTTNTPLSLIGISSTTSASAPMTIQAAGAFGAAALGNNLTLNAGYNATKGGQFTINGGQGAAGGNTQIGGGDATTGIGGDLILNAGFSNSSAAGNVFVNGGISSSGTGGYIVFSTSPVAGLTERFRITKDGAWSIGTGGAAYGTSGQVLMSNGNAAPTWSSNFTGSASLNVLKAGDTMTGSLTVDGSSIFITSPAATGAFYYTRTSGTNRWVFGHNNQAESGADAGSNFQIRRYTDAGAFIDAPIQITRSSGAVSIPTSLTVSGAITGSVTGSASLNVLKAGDTMTGDFIVSRNVNDIAGIQIVNQSAGNIASTTLILTNNNNKSAGFDIYSNAYTGYVNEAWLYTNGASLNFSGDAANRHATLTPAGNFGIGITPVDRLHASTSTQARVATFESTAGATVAVMLKNTGSGGTPAQLLGVSDGLGFQTNGVTRMLVNGAGSVGINTTSPQTILDVSSGGATRIRASSSGANTVFRGFDFGIAGNSQSYGSMTMNINSGEVRHEAGYSGWGGFHTFYTDAVLRMSIGSTGLVTVNSTALAGAFLTVGQTGAASASVLATNHTAASGTRYHAVFHESGTERGSITSNGSAVAYNTTSDARLKNTIVDAGSASTLIDALRVRSFKWNSTDEQENFGMVAQELVQVVPSAVAVGDADEEISKPWGVDYSKLVPLLIKEIQELRARVAALEAA